MSEGGREGGRERRGSDTGREDVLINLSVNLFASHPFAVSEMHPYTSDYPNAKCIFFNQDFIKSSSQKKISFLSVSISRLFFLLFVVFLFVFFFFFWGGGRYVGLHFR